MLVLATIANNVANRLTAPNAGTLCDPSYWTIKGTAINVTIAVPHKCKYFYPYSSFSNIAHTAGNSSTLRFNIPCIWAMAIP